VSAEKFARRSVVEVVVCRVASEMLAGVGVTISSIGKTIECAAQGIFLLECDAARRYKAATGYDLGGAAGYPKRYSDLAEEIAVEPGSEDDDHFSME